MDKIVIVSESFVLKDSLVDVFKHTFNSDNVVCISSINTDDELHLVDVDFMLIDASIDKNSVLEYILIAKQSNLGCKILVLDYKNSKDLFFNSVKMGVEGYILNILDKDEFIYIIKRIASGKKFYDSELLQYDVDNSINSVNNLLTNRERCVLNYVSKGLSNKDIAESLEVTDYTIKKHVSSILTKLKLRNRQDIIVYAKENNILDEIC